MRGEDALPWSLPERALIFSADDVENSVCSGVLRRRRMPTTKKRHSRDGLLRGVGIRRSIVRQHYSKTLLTATSSAASGSAIQSTPADPKYRSPSL